MANKFNQLIKLVISAVCLTATIAYASTDSTSDKKTNNGGAQRIIALAPHVVENLYAIGAGDRIIGTTDHADYPESAKTIKRIGNYARLNIEDIIALDPDLVIAWKSGNPDSDISRLESFGIKIVYSKPKYIEDVATELRFFGELTGLEDNAERVASEFLAAYEALKAKYQGKTPISAFYELWPRPLTTVARESWLQQQLDLCAATNPFKHAENDYPQVGIEQVVLKAPAIIIQPTSHSNAAPDAVNWKQWASIPAVKHEGFIHPNSDMLYRMTTRFLGEVSLLCQQIDDIRNRIN